jgi:hypothetical protein
LRRSWASSPHAKIRDKSEQNEANAHESGAKTHEKSHDNCLFVLKAHRWGDHVLDAPLAGPVIRSIIALRFISRLMTGESRSFCCDAPPCAG